MTKNRIDILDHQFGNVWNMIEDEVPVGTDQAGHMNVFVIDPKVVAFPDKSFDDFDHGALSKVIRPRLKTETEDTNPFVSLFHDELQALHHL